MLRDEVEGQEGWRDAAVAWRVGEGRDEVEGQGWRRSSSMEEEEGICVSFSLLSFSTSIWAYFRSSSTSSVMRSESAQIGG